MSALQVEVFPIEARRWIAVIEAPAGPFSTEVSSPELVAGEVARVIREVLGAGHEHVLVDETGQPWGERVAREQLDRLTDEWASPSSARAVGAGDPGMSDENGFRYVPLRPVPEGSGPAKTRAFDLDELEVVATVAVCDVDETPTANTLPSISLRITQCVRLADESLVRLDMDRGVTSVRHGAADGEAVSWKRPADELIAEILDLVRPDDEDDPEAHPWAELADAARKRGVDVEAATLSGLPYQVLLSAEVISSFVL